MFQCVTSHIRKFVNFGKFQSRYALEAPKIEGGHNDIIDGFVRGRPVKKPKKVGLKLTCQPEGI